jgi:hypothetical protein
MYNSEFEHKMTNAEYVLSKWVQYTVVPWPVFYGINCLMRHNQWIWKRWSCEKYLIYNSQNCIKIQRSSFRLFYSIFCVFKIASNTRLVKWNIPEVCCDNCLFSILIIFQFDFIMKVLIPVLILTFLVFILKQNNCFYVEDCLWTGNKILMVPLGSRCRLL